ncbi:MAG: terminase large subunit, partial [Rectinemataceae bacterium]
MNRRNNAVLLAVLVMIAAASLRPEVVYAEKVLSGEIVACNLVKLAAQRHLGDMLRQDTPGFPYHFDNVRADHAIAFIEQLRHVEGPAASTMGGRDNRIKLELWEKFFVGQIFGWRREDGTRRFRHCYLEVARKNAKTTLAAGIANVVYWADRPEDPGCQIYFGATKQEQAVYAWRIARLQIERHPVLKLKARTYESKQYIVKTTMDARGRPQADWSSRIRPLGRDSKTEDGLNPSMAVIDEYHAHQTSEILDVLESGMMARLQPLTLILTTAGSNFDGPCYQVERPLAIGILEKTMQPIPEDCFALIYTLDEGDDFANPSVWIKANPNLGVSVYPSQLESRVQIALAAPAKARDVKTKNFNIWSQAFSRWIKDEIWMACGDPVVENELAGRHCTLAFDLSTNTDLTAVAAAFSPVSVDEKWKTFWRLFMPMENLLERERQDKVPYTEWERMGLIIPTDGNTVDYDFIEQEIRSLGEKYIVDEIAYDPFKAGEVVAHLGTEFTMISTAQRYNPMSIYSDIFERLVRKGEFSHGGNPVLRWMMSCT